MLAPISSLVYSEPDFGAKIWHMIYIGIIFQTIITPHIGSSPISIWVPKLWVLEVEKNFLLHIWWFLKWKKPIMLLNFEKSWINLEPRNFPSKSPPWYWCLSVSVSADMKKILSAIYRIGRFEKWDLSVLIGIGRYEKKLIGRTLAGGGQEPLM